MYGVSAGTKKVAVVERCSTVTKTSKIIQLIQLLA